MFTISKDFIFHFFIFIIFSCTLISCGDKEDDPTPADLPDRPVVTWQTPPETDRIYYTDEAVVLQAIRTGGHVQDIEWTINGVAVTNAQEIIVNADTSSISLAHSFDAAGRYDVSLRVANEGGETVIIQVLNFEVRPIPKLDLIAGQVSKKWQFTSIKLNEVELIEDHEADNTLEFFRENQVDGNVTYNCVFDKGTITNGESNSNGRWVLAFGDTYIDFTRINVFPNSVRIVELTSTEMTLGRREGDSEILYKLTFIP